MTIALVGTAVTNSNGSGTTSLAVTKASVTTGNGLLVMVTGNQTLSSLTDSGGVTPTLLKGQTCSDAPLFFGRLYFIPNLTGGSHTITATFGTSADCAIAIQEVSGLFSATLDKSNGNGVYGSTINTGSTGTLTQSVELAIALAQNCNSNFTATTPSGWTVIASNSFAGSSGWSFIYQITSATTALNPAWTTPGGSYEQANVVATLIAGAAPPAATLSTPTPSGTLSTAFNANPGATTDTSGGIGYAVVTTSSLSGVTATQVKAGQNAAGSTSGVLSGTVSINATGAFTVPVSGLSASTLYNYAVVENTAGGDSNVVSGTFTTAPPPPVISGLSSTTPAPGSSLIISGSAFNSTQSGGSVAVGGVAQTVTAWADTSITVTVVQGTLLYGATSVTVTNGVTGSTSAGSSCTLTPPSGWSYITVGTPDPTTSERLTTTTTDIATSDQISWGNLNSSGSVVVNTDGSWTYTPGVSDPVPVTFDYRVGTPGSGYGSTATETLGASSSTKTANVHTYAIRASSDTKLYSQYPNGNHP